MGVQRTSPVLGPASCRINGWPRGAAIGGWRPALLAMLAMFVALAGTPAAVAQPCTADVQCRDGGLSRTYCAGNAVVTVRSVCAGSCRTIEERREVCAGGCAGGICTAAPSPRVTPGSELAGCVAACDCRERRLTVLTGRRTTDGGCERRTITCRRGCTCDPAPRCR